MASLALIAVLKLTVGGTLWLGASAFPLATHSDSDTCPLAAGVPTCPLEDGDGFDRVSLLAYSTKLATQRGMLQESTQVSPKLAKQRDMTRQSSSQDQQGASMGPKCAHAKCYECARALIAPPEIGKRFYANPADGPAPFHGSDLLQAFEQEKQQDVIWRIQPGVIEDVMKDGGIDKKYPGGFCQEWYSLREGVEDENAKPASCFRKAGRHDVDLKVTSVQGPKLSPEDICNSCECEIIEGENPIYRLPVTVDHLGLFQQAMEQKVTTTLCNVVAKVFSTIWKYTGKKALDFAGNFLKGLGNLVLHPITWWKDTENQRVALKVLKFGFGVTLAVSAGLTGTALLGPAAAFAVHAALSVAQAGHAKYNGASKKQVAGMLVMSIGVGSITATVGIPDVTASWLLPDFAAAIDGVAGAAGSENVMNILDGSVPTESVTGLDAVLGKATEAFDEALDKASAFKEEMDELGAKDDSPGGKRLKAGIKKAAGIYEGKVWKKMAAEEAQKKSNPSTLAQVLKLQENLCEEAGNEWTTSLQESVRAAGLPESAPQVRCGILSGADIEAAAPSDVMAKYEPVIYGTLEDFLGDLMPPVKGNKKESVSGAVVGSPEGAVIDHAVSGAAPPLHGDAAIKDSVERENDALKNDPNWKPPHWG